eukprot:CAMPEP_0174878036 /NCGR_PEP_ID=MMETSP1114-20130205/82557_1 /TAXON_ID=312471 /ORGANISM="Neobodo designis, Strain CCAP 1951/1" /LENGTH=467 /DNA_ID=CAMNT_0016113423 /DNA_START=1451 /DNA_END=2854 /DNA_ORIENTATION=+
MSTLDQSTESLPQRSRAVRAVPKPRHGDATNLYVGSLHPSVTDADLAQRFGAFGTIVSAKVMLNIHTGESRGMGFVKFDKKESAIAALQALHRATVNGQRILVRFADARADYHPGEKTNRVFVRNIPLDVNATAVRALFAPYGPVLECNLQLDSAGWKNGGCGVRTRMAFVTFETVAAAEAAAAAVHATRPFPNCHAALMAKIAESENRRHERKTVPPGSASDSSNTPLGALTAQTASSAGVSSSARGSDSTPQGGLSDEPTSSSTESKGAGGSSSDKPSSGDDEPVPSPRSRPGSIASTPAAIPDGNVGTDGSAARIGPDRTTAAAAGTAATPPATWHPAHHPSLGALPRVGSNASGFPGGLPAALQTAGAFPTTTPSLGVPPFNFGAVPFPPPVPMGGLAAPFVPSMPPGFGLAPPPFAWPSPGPIPVVAPPSQAPASSASVPPTTVSQGTAGAEVRLPGMPARQ